MRTKTHWSGLGNPRVVFEELKETYFQRSRPIGDGGGYWQRVKAARMLSSVLKNRFCVQTRLKSVCTVCTVRHCVHCVSDSTQRLGSCSARVHGVVIVALLQLLWNIFCFSPLPLHCNIAMHWVQDLNSQAEVPPQHRLTPHTSASEALSASSKTTPLKL